LISRGLSVKSTKEKDCGLIWEKLRDLFAKVAGIRLPRDLFFLKNNT
jgi:hypothetical protein